MEPSVQLKQFVGGMLANHQKALQAQKMLDAGMESAVSASDFNGHRDQAFGHVTYAQHGEDLIVMNIFHLIGIPRPTYIDVGAHHPLNISNTALLYKRGSRGINVEANPHLIHEFHKLRPDDTNLNVGVGEARGQLEFYYIDDYSGRNTFDKEAAELFVKQYPAFKIRNVERIEIRPLDELIDEHAGGVYPDFLTIDVEGWDYRVLAAADFTRSRPKVICAEVVSSAPGDVSGDLTRLLKTRGFVPYARTVGNIIFVDQAVFAEISV